MGKIAHQHELDISYQSRYPAIVRHEHLTREHLVQLCQGKRLAIVIPQFLSKTQCGRILHKLRHTDTHMGKYDNAPELDIYRMGMAFFETRFNHQLLDAYFQLANHYMDDLNTVFSPYNNPFQKLFRTLETTWAQGLVRQQLYQKNMMPGLIRLFRENQVFPPHQDMLNRDEPDLPREEHPQSQLAINLHLSSFQQGGELELWDYAPDDATVKTLYTGHQDFIDRQKIPVVSRVIKPAAGDLILFQSSKLHAVRAGQTGTRASFACFAAYRGTHRPLTYWI